MGDSLEAEERVLAKGNDPAPATLTGGVIVPGERQLYRIHRDAVGVGRGYEGIARNLDARLPCPVGAVAVAVNRFLDMHPAGVAIINGGIFYAAAGASAGAEKYAQ